MISLICLISGVSVVNGGFLQLMPILYASKTPVVPQTTNLVRSLTCFSKLWMSSSFILVVGLVTGTLAVIVFIWNMTYLYSAQLPRPLGPLSQEEILAYERFKPIQEVIDTIKRRYLAAGHCDINTFTEGLFNRTFELRPPAKHAVITVGRLRTFLDSRSSHWHTLLQPNDVDMYLYIKMNPRPTATDCFSLIPALASGRVRALTVH